MIKKHFVGQLRLIGSEGACEEAPHPGDLVSFCGVFGNRESIGVVVETTNSTGIEMTSVLWANDPTELGLYPWGRTYASSVAKSIIEVQPMPDGAIPHWFNHVIKT